MATPNAQAPDETLALLTRLSQKPGVQSTLVLSRESGAIVRTSGLISQSSQANPNSTLPASGDSAAGSDGTAFANGRKEGAQMNAESVAKMVWEFVKSAGQCVRGLEGKEGTEGVERGEDEMKLLRLRTRKFEVVIVPDAKYLLVVIHDTPPA